MLRKALSEPKGWHIHGPGMVPGVIAGGFIFLSALRGQNPITQEYSEDASAQAHQVFDNIEGLLAEAGATLDHVVKVTLYLDDLRHRSAFHEVWMQRFPTNPPARIAMEVADANAIPGRGALFALDVIALAP